MRFSSPIGLAKLLACWRFLHAVPSADLLLMSEDQLETAFFRGGVFRPRVASHSICVRVRNGSLFSGRP